MNLRFYSNRNIAIEEILAVSDVDFYSCVTGLEIEEFGKELRYEFWRNLSLIAKADLQVQSRSEGVSSGVNEAVREEIEALLEKKDMKAAEKDERGVLVSETLQNGGDIDVEYWEVVLDRVKYYIARARVNQIDKSFVDYKERHGHKGATNEVGGEMGELEKEEEMIKGESKKGMGENEEKFNEEVNLDKKYAWNNKYKPRKPKYFNRVHTGYEWNKYNQTHYDHDNPPPKTVQGYKFNIFYPDLIDKSKAPGFKIQKTDNPDVCILRFVAGPPYEDIAFKIVNREWEHSHKKGFKCTFERGIFHLW
eukprot:CAMPEP_0184742086 /NCGR_PEP_ID=MMETSP0315-20130426/5106_1 /TAXON_ID=101924 /ORGANISM="Rhodosorus marinus, Strain UTEX LB 2760" /LENGTH=306 /DNA_ID=CAMNT_0027212777 /DNA_START=130 /DNA_END=1047 /DNA_ORIENTATION=-